MRADLALYHKPSALGIATSYSNQIAITAGTKILILTPRYGEFEEVLEPVDFDIKPGSTSKYKEVQREDTDEMISLALENDPFSIGVAWSPPGLSLMHGCLLAALDSYHRVSIWQSSGRGKDEWILMCNLSDLVFEERILKDNMDRINIIAGNSKLNAEQCRILQIHSMAWSPITSNTIGHKHCILAVGTETAEVTFWSFSRNQQPQYLSKLQLPADTNTAITHLAWSPLFANSNSGEEIEKFAILAISAMDGSVHLALLSLSSSLRPENEMTTSCMSIVYTKELLPNQRIPVSKLTWQGRNEDIILAIARNGILTLSIHQHSEIETLPSKLVTCRHQNFSPVVDLLFTPNEDSLDILLISQLLPPSCFRLSTDNNLVPLPAPTQLLDFFASKHDAYSPATEKNFFKIIGVAASPNNLALTFYYDLTPNDRPQYRTPLEYKSRLSTAISVDVDVALMKHLEGLDGLISERQASPAKYAWEGKVLYEAASVEQKLAFITRLRNRLDPLVLEVQQPGPEGINDLSPDMIIWQYWTALNRMSQVLADAPLPKDLQTRLQHLNSTALSLIQNYIRKGLQTLSRNPVISTSLRIYDAIFDDPEESQEPCGVCGLLIPAKSFSVGSCSNGHIFQRCSITLLTLSTPYVHTCKVCDRKKLDVRAFREDVDWREMVFPGIGVENFIRGFPEIERCLYCGGEWYCKF